ncbi:MAG: CcmD family protein [Oligoflexia bacterium]|nr:CcmD family protein [Oligoflexia bacterium]
MECPPDTMSSLFFAYTAVWIILALYIMALGRRVSKLASKEHCDHGS